ncbi:MAG TPA: DUF3131 domain-containing protein [Ramlibacter sp.]|uniref:DUF3131 domain-containing protein n=1 Tax=Ramlibacter sp. TaxID=1917967 RepID=UPI002ED32B0A
MESNLVKARATIVWILAILVAFGAVWWIEKQSGKELIARRNAASAGAASPQLPDSTGIAATPAPRALNEQEKAWAAVAWRYFEENTNPETGLAPSVAGFQGTTMWDTASYLLAVLSAHDLGLIEKRGFDLRIAKALVALETMPLYGGQLPNKSYDVGSLDMTDYANQAAPQGVGWSAIDIGRLLVPLNTIVWQHSVHTPAVRRVLARWNTEQLARGGELFGMQHAAGAQPRATQEGRLGYEQYAARTFELMGLDVEGAADWRRHLRLVDVGGVQVCADARDPKRFGAQNYVVSEPYALSGLEFGWTRSARECAWRVYRAQEQRFRSTGVLTAVSEDHVDQAPYFVYNSVWSAGRAWATVNDKGEDAAPLRTLSTKAAFAWHALFRTDYTAQLVAKAATLQEPGRGFQAGLYEEGGKPNRALTANTNAVILESLAYIARGPALQVHRPGERKP